MSGQALRTGRRYACAYCGEPLAFTSFGVTAWRAGDRFVCNEFCADGLLPRDDDTEKAPTVLRLT
jgi:hypothetical protein